MSHSNSSLNTFADCQAKYEHRYVLRTPIVGPISPHLTFGSMAHEVLHKAGLLRDAYKDGVLVRGDYIEVIPSEVLHSDLKTFFNIRSWERYFTDVIKQTAKYEDMLIKEIIGEGKGDVRIEREVKINVPTEKLLQLGYVLDQALVGVIDLLILTDTHAYVIDYKFSTKQKTQDDFDMDSQLPLYGMLVHTTYGIPLYNIKYGYIDILKQDFGMPTILTNGTISRSKSQNVSQEMYGKAIEAVHKDRGDWDEDLLKPGGYYYDAWCNMALNKIAYMSMQWLDLEVYNGVVKDLFNAAKMIDHIVKNKMPFLKKYSSYSCKNCEYLTNCKPWLEVNNDRA